MVCSGILGRSLVHVASRAFGVLALLAWAANTHAGPIEANPQDARWLYQDGAPFFFCGPGDPENFFHRGTLNPNGTRNGDQNAIIQEITGTGANALWMTAVRSHGGDGGPTENPFVNHDPAQGVNDAVLDQWEGWIAALDAAEIVSFFVFYDDGTRVWNTGSVVGPQEAAFLQTIVDRFESYDHLIWCVCEEYQEAFDMARVSAIAAVIDQHDQSDHAIAVHQLENPVFHFPDDPVIDVHAMHCGPNSTPALLHSKVLSSWNNSAGRYHVIMAESIGHYSERTAARKLSWAAAMGGATVLVHALDVASTPVEALEDCGRLRDFFQGVPFQGMAPNDAIKRGQTEYVFGAVDFGYVLYASNLTGSMGFAAPSGAAGPCDLVWFDCITGSTVVQSVVVVAGDNLWPKPGGLGSEVALAVLPSGVTAQPQGIESASWGRIKGLFR